jgi:hypothetical protein
MQRIAQEIGSDCGKPRAGEADQAAELAGVAIARHRERGPEYHRRGYKQSAEAENLFAVGRAIAPPAVAEVPAGTAVVCRFNFGSVKETTRREAKWDARFRKQTYFERAAVTAVPVSTGPLRG